MRRHFGKPESVESSDKGDVTWTYFLTKHKKGPGQIAMVAASPIVALARLGGGEKTKQKQLAITFNRVRRSTAGLDRLARALGLPYAALVALFRASRIGASASIFTCPPPSRQRAISRASSVRPS